MGKYHPHGDSAIYPTLVRMAQGWNMRTPLIDPQGNFGSMDGDPRRTEIVEAIGEFVMEELIPDERVVVTISHQGYIKRTDSDTYRRQGRGGRGIRGGDTKEGDFLEYLFVVSTHDFLLFFTSRGRVYWARVFDLPAQARTARGRSIANLLRLQPNETLCAVLPVRRFEENFVFFATANGIVKKSPVGAFSRPRPSGIIAITLDPGGIMLRTDLSGIREIGRATQGVRIIRPDAGDRVVAVAKIAPDDEGAGNAAEETVSAPGAGESGAYYTPPAKDDA